MENQRKDEGEKVSSLSRSRREQQHTQGGKKDYIGRSINRKSGGLFNKNEGKKGVMVGKRKGSQRGNWWGKT